MESLRCDSPVMLLYRVATCDTEVGGVSINKGELVGNSFGTPTTTGPASTARTLSACPLADVRLNCRRFTQ
jgi:hypothetical protein